MPTASKVETFMIDPYEVPAGSTIRKGMPVKFSSGKVVETTSTDAIGIALDAADGNNNQTKYVRVHRFGCGIVPVLCSGVIAQGTKVKPDTDGVAAIVVGAGTVFGQCIGTLVEAGAAGELAGLDVGNLTSVVTA